VTGTGSPNQIDTHVYIYDRYAVCGVLPQFDLKKRTFYTSDEVTRF
jgi:hypothetical protein